MFFGELVRFAVKANSGVIEQNVNATKPSHRLIDRVCNRRVIAHITREHESLASLRLHLPFERFQIVHRTERIARMRNLPGNIVGDDPRPFTGKRQRSCTSLSVRSAGDECNFSFEVTSHVAKPTSMKHPT